MSKHDEIYELFKLSPFIEDVGIEMKRTDDGKIYLQLDVKNKHLNMNDITHGGVLATLLDVVLGMTIIDETKSRGVTMNLNINYLGQSFAGKRVFAMAEIVQRGNQIVTAEADVYTKDNQLLCKGIATFKLINK